MCCLHTLIQWFLLDELGQETCTTEGQLEQESRENTDSQQATQKCIKGKKTGKSYLLQKHHLHRLCRQCPWGQFSVQGMSQPCHLNREGTRDSDIQDRSNKSKAKRQNNKKKVLLWARVVSSFPWVNTTILCLFVFTLDKAWAFLAISLMSLVYSQNTQYHG